MEDTNRATHSIMTPKQTARWDLLTLCLDRAEAKARRFAPGTTARLQHEERAERYREQLIDLLKDTPRPQMTIEQMLEKSLKEIDAVFFAECREDG